MRFATIIFKILDFFMTNQGINEVQDETQITTKIYLGKVSDIEAIRWIDQLHA